jgi:hypothetical protein
MGQIVGNLHAAIFARVDGEGREFPQLLRFAEYSDIPFGSVITSAARDLLVHGYGKSRFLAPKPGARNDKFMNHDPPLSPADVSL